MITCFAIINFTHPKDHEQKSLNFMFPNICHHQKFKGWPLAESVTWNNPKKMEKWTPLKGRSYCSSGRATLLVPPAHIYVVLYVPFLIDPIKINHVGIPYMDGMGKNSQPEFWKHILLGTIMRGQLFQWNAYKLTWFEIGYIRHTAVVSEIRLTSFQVASFSRDWPGFDTSKGVAGSLKSTWIVAKHGVIVRNN